MRLVTFPRRRLGSVRLDRNPHGKGWFLVIQLGPGRGYRWMDFGPYSQNINDPWYTKLSISGRTLTMGWHVKDWRHRHPVFGDHPRRHRFGFQWFTKKCDLGLVPGWWV